MITVVIVDDETLLRTGLERILDASGDVRVVATADARSAIPVISRTRPDVVLLDIRMPERDGLSILRELRRRGESAKVVMLTTFDTDEHIADALDAGASGFLLKDTDPENLPQFVRAVAGGGIVLTASVGRQVVAGIRPTGRSDHDAQLLAALSPREILVLKHLSDGLSNAEIGRRIHLSVGTVKDDVGSILAKLHVTTRVQAALVAERSGLFPDASEG